VTSGPDVPRRPRGQALGDGRWSSAATGGRAGPRRTTLKMHRGERQHIFAHYFSSKIKCFTDLAHLLEEEIAMHSDFRKPYFSVCLLLLEFVLVKGADHHRAFWTYHL
jgi:hypothetical protein